MRRRSPKSTERVRVRRMSITFEAHDLLTRDADPISMASSPDSGSESELPFLDNLPPEIASAVQFYWETRSGQAEEQRASSNTARGRRAEVLGGGQKDGFAGLVEDLLVAEGVPRESVKHDYQATLPDFFRHEKVFPFWTESRTTLRSLRGRF